MTALALALLALLAVATIVIVVPLVALAKATSAEHRLRALEQRVAALAAGSSQAAPPGPAPETGGVRLESPPPVVIQAPPPEQPRVAGTPAAGTHEQGPSLEERIGGRWLLYAGVVAIFLAAAFFVKYAFENAWVTPTLRVVIGTLAGLTLAAAGRHFARRGYALYGQMLAGAGSAILYLSIYAALNVYALIGPLAAFASMLGVTTLTAWLATTQSALGLALMAVLGGYATPFLVSTGRDAQLFLFTYVALLVAATMFLARRQQWPVLNVASFLLTGATVAAWAARFYTPGKWLTTELFITLYCAMFVYVLARTLRGPALTARVAALVLATGPVIYHAASLVILNPRPLATLVYLLLFSGLGIVAAHRWQAVAVRAAVWLAVAAPFLSWVVQHRGAQWLLPGLAALFGLYGLHLSATFRDLADRYGRLRPLEVGLLHVNGAWACIALLTLLAPHAAAWQGRAALLLALAHAVMASAVWKRITEGALHFLALAFALLAVAVAVEFEGAWLIAAWAAEGFALAWIGLAVGRTWLRVAGAAAFAGALAQLFGLVSQPAPVHYVLVANPRAGLMVFLVILLYGAAWLHRRHAASLEAGGRHEVAALVSAANLLTWLLITVEVNRAFGIRAWEASVDRGFGAMTDTDLARQTTLSIAWSAFALALIVAGFVRRYAPLRYIGIAIFGYTVAKVAVVDLARLERIYRILSVFALGVLLLVASYLYQRFAGLVDPPRASGKEHP